MQGEVEAAWAARARFLKIPEVNFWCGRKPEQCLEKISWQPMASVETRSVLVLVAAGLWKNQRDGKRVGGELSEQVRTCARRGRNICGRY